MENKNKNLKKVSLFMEKFWLVLAVISLAVVLYVFYTQGINGETAQYLIFPGLAALMFAFRRFFRKRLERMEDRDSR